eukprot:CAMPEP_0204605334 /NCGR_PEP_ID=MMETSP0661-20131031/58420_1 /ASSEMBLY_ACC=CAM_ASM_000606 /TAXON_ID=109239 /ORGANISM="Alexandrium margalefi, Strain AMGDE01CS-322" /LENGTH=32 /DNA_ID= /DNA_START= /DNA_END= /DNA_ORIENTATION=
METHLVQRLEVAPLPTAWTEHGPSGARPCQVK